MFVVKEEK